MFFFLKRRLCNRTLACALYRKVAGSAENSPIPEAATVLRWDGEKKIPIIMAEYKAKPAGLAKRIYYLPTPYCQNRFGRGASPLQSNKPTVAIFFVIYTFFFFLNTKGYYFFFFFWYGRLNSLKRRSTIVININYALDCEFAQLFVYASIR